jgi:hypothetical protein
LGASATAKNSPYFAPKSLAVVVVMWAIGDFGLLAIVAVAKLVGRLTASLPLVARHPFSGWALYFR